MTSPLFRPVTADTTKVTADVTTNRPVARMSARLRALLPPSWFASGPTPVLDIVLSATATPLTWLRALLDYVLAQNRIGSATGIWLDFIALDYFGLRFRRHVNERDDPWRDRIKAELLRPRVTREALTRAIVDLTGIAPDILEPFNPGDCGAYGIGSLAYGGPGTIEPTLTGYGGPLGGYGAGFIAYGQPVGSGPTGGGAGAYGSLSLPKQIFVTVRRPVPAFGTLGACGGYGIGPFAYGGGRDGVPALPGYGGTLGGYGEGATSYGVPAPPYEYFAGAGYYQTRSEQVSIPDEEIYATVAQTVAAGVTAWTRIQGA